ncbi:MAG: hypothetical protein ACRDTX_15660 [Pseudonocardiaceae bacterium]
MASHRRTHALARVFRRRPLKTPIPTPRRPGIEMVDGITRVRHRVSSDALRAGRLAGDYQAMCGVRVLAGSPTDQGLRCCPQCSP